MSNFVKNEWTLGLLKSGKVSLELKGLSLAPKTLANFLDRYDTNDIGNKGRPGNVD